MVRALDLYSEGRGFDSHSVCIPLVKTFYPQLLSLDPGVVNGYPSGISSLKCTVCHEVAGAKAGVIRPKKNNCYVALTRPKSENWVGRSIFFFFLRTVRELSFPIFF